MDLKLHSALSTLDPFAAITGIAGSSVTAIGIVGGYLGIFLIGSLLVVLAAMEWSLSRRFARHEAVEVRDKTEMLEAQRRAFVEHIETSRREVKQELGRMTMVFDGMAASYDLASRRALKVEEELRGTQEELDLVEDKVDRFDKRLSEMETLIRGAKRPA